MSHARAERVVDAKAPVVLVVDDDAAIRTVVRWQLDDAGFRVVEADDGPSALRRIRDDHPTLVVLDLSLPGLGGLDVLRSVRGGHNGRSDTPIIVLSGRDGETDRIVGLDLGADDYLVKPFSLGELLARMRVALRHRGTALQPAVTRYEHGGVLIDLTAHRASLAGEPVHLTPTEFKLLARLVRSAGQVVTHRQLLADVWGPEYTAHTHYLRLYMAQLRAKLEVEPADPQRLLTEPGVGYRLTEPTG